MPQFFSVYHSFKHLCSPIERHLGYFQLPQFFLSWNSLEVLYFLFLSWNHTPQSSHLTILWGYNMLQSFHLGILSVNAGPSFFVLEFFMGPHTPVFLSWKGSRHSIACNPAGSTLRGLEPPALRYAALSTVAPWGLSFSSSPSLGCNIMAMPNKKQRKQ